MASIYKERGKWTCTWFDSKRKRHFIRGLASKALAVEIASRRELSKTLAKHRLVDDKVEKYSAQAERPITEHLDDYRKWLKSRGRTVKYIDDTLGMVRRVFESAGIDRIDQIDRHAVETAAAALSPRKRIPDPNLSHRTRNKAVAACRSFGYWLAGTAHRLPAPPLIRVKGLDEELDQRRRRVALDEEQVVNLIHVTATQPTRGGMSGIDRMMRYAMGIGTGFRQGTLFSLTPESFHLDDPDGPFVRAEAGNMKGRKAVDHPISDELATLIRPWLAAKPKGKPVFPRLPHARPVIAYRHDLKAAGIEYHAEGTIQYCDQHAQRNTFITAVIRAAGLKVAQDLAHHSTPVLTSKYGRMDMSDYGKALAGLPKLKREQVKKKVAN
ncbi:MAG: tyrosine-type recombinase/integrase [Patescibacteria group bacterium]|nr:tyrosine-type recombinase/integrase [Patescibacteria group bacterium]